MSVLINKKGEVLAGLVPKGESVSINVTTSMTNGQAFTQLLSAADLTKVSVGSHIDFLGNVYSVTAMGSTFLKFGTWNGLINDATYAEVLYQNEVVTFVSFSIFNHTRNDITSANVWTNGTITLYY